MSSKYWLAQTQWMFYVESYVYWTVHHCNSWRIRDQTWCHLLFYFTSYVLNMFRTLIYPSSGACDCSVELPHRSFFSRFVVCWRFGASVLQAAACNTDTTQTQPHQISNTQRTENKRTDVVIQQHSRKLLMMDILMSETCWAHKKWNKIASDTKVVFYSSNIILHVIL
jgi:hypothetical protein